MTRVGIVGLGFMGKMHLGCYNAADDAKVVAICDADKSRFEDTGGTAGNISGAEEPLDLSGIELFTDFDKMLKKMKLDAVSITLPTYLHRDFTVKALEARVNVMCEKPMALNEAECKDMISAAKKSGKVLQVGHCIRFWPEYAKTKEIVESGEYGGVTAASFTRLSATPTWSWNSWLMDDAKSGGALTDLHIHDADFVQYLFGMPRAVYCRAVKGPTGGFDHVFTQYRYDDDKAVAAEGGWVMTPAFGFEMSFHIVLEKADIVFDCTQEPAFRVCSAEQTVTPETEAGDGYSLEIAHFVKLVSGKKVPEIITPDQSLDSLRLVLAEKRSAQTGKEIRL